MIKQVKNQATALAALALTAMANPALATNSFDGSDAGKSYTGGSNLETANENVETLAEDTFNMIKIVGMLIGVVMIAIGLMRLKKSQDQQSGVSPMQGIFLILIGGAFAVLPFLLFTSANTVQNSSTS